MSHRRNALRWTWRPQCWNGTVDEIDVSYSHFGPTCVAERCVRAPQNGAFTTNGGEMRIPTFRCSTERWWSTLRSPKSSRGGEVLPETWLQKFWYDAHKSKIDNLTHRTPERFGEERCVALRCVAMRCDPFTVEVIPEKWLCKIWRCLLNQVRFKTASFKAVFRGSRPGLGDNGQARQTSPFIQVTQCTWSVNGVHYTASGPMIIEGSNLLCTFKR